MKSSFAWESKYVCAFLFLVFLMPALSKGQGANQYSYTSIRSGTFTPIAGNQVIFTNSNPDDDFANGLPIGFSFIFDGGNYRFFNISTNGWITFGTATVPNNITTSGTGNSFNALPRSPLLAPLWDDIAISFADLSGSDVTYTTLGTAPNQRLVIQYDSVRWNWRATTACLRFQIILYETTNVIDFVYEQVSTATNFPGASIGIASANGNFLSLSSASFTATASSTVNTTNINTLPETGQIFRFTPPPPCTGTPAPGATAATRTSICNGSTGASATTVLSFPPIPANNLSYQWQSGPSASGPWSSSGPTTATWTDAPTSTTWYRCLVTCTNTNNSGASTPVQVVIDSTCILMPPGQSSTSQCGGTFYDGGGPLANYTNFLDNTFTIFPSTPGSAVRVTFTAFSTENGFDGLSIFNGNSTGAPLISSGLPAGIDPVTAPAGSFYGTTSPGTITSTAADGSLTFVFTSDDIVTAAGWAATISCIPPCSGTPNPDSTLSSQAFVCSGFSTNLTLKNSFSGLTYNWQSSPDNITYTSVGATTSTYSPTLSGVNTWFRCEVTCTSSGRSAFSIPVLVTSANCDNITMPSNGTVLLDTTCAGLFVDNGGISNNYSDGARGRVTIYPATVGRKVRAAFTSFSTENRWDGMMIYNGPDTTFPLISSGLPVGANATTAPAGSFYGTTSPGTVTSTAADGTLTFVFRSDPSINLAGWQAIISCFDANACVGTPAPGNTVASRTTICYGATSNLSLQNTTAGTGVTYQWQSGSSSTGPWSAASGNGTLSTYLAQPRVSTWFRCIVTCSGNPGTSTPALITVDPTCINMPDTGSIATCNATFYDVGGSNGNYNDNESQTFTIRPGAANSLVNVVFNTFSLDQDDTLKVYNGIGTAALIGAYTTSPGTLTSTNATNGALTFVFTSNSSVNDIGWSATVSCVPNTVCTSPTGSPGNAVATADTVCIGSTVGLSLSASLGLGVTYQWQQSTTGATTGFSDIPTSVNNPSTNPSYLATVSSTGWYRCNVNCLFSGVVSSVAVKVTAVTQPTINSSSQTGSICSSGTGTLTASASAGTIRWYTVASGGTPVGSGTTFITPSISATTTYYVGSSLGDCQSDRTAVIALVSPNPSGVTVTPASGNICAAPNITEISATGGLFPDGSEAPVRWSPVTYLYIDAAATIPYTANANVRTVYCMPPVAANGSSITYTATAGTNCTRSATSVISVQDIRPDITISITRPVPPAAICSSDSVEFRTTPLPAGLGAQAAYRWFIKRGVSTIQVPIPGASYTTAYNIVRFPGTSGFPALQSGDSVFCVMLVSPTAIICSDSRFDTSNKVRVNITTTIRDSVVLVASRNPICRGESVTFTATPYTTAPYGSPGATPSYQFFVNGSPVGTAGNNTYTTSTLDSGNVVTVRMTPSATCVLPNPAVSVPITMDVRTKFKPTFDPAAFIPICLGGTINLPTTSLNGYTGTWSPAVNNTLSTTYTFNPNQCADTVIRTVIVNSTPATPTFNTVAPICSPATGTLPANSIEGFTGSWTPSSTYAASGTFTFTPTAGLCANTTTLTVTVNSVPTASISSNSGSVCSGATGQFFISGTPNGVLTYNINGAANTTVTLSGTGTATITLLNMTVAATLNLVSITANGCTNNSISTSVNNNIGIVSTSGSGPLSGSYSIPVIGNDCVNGVRGFPTIKQAIDSLNTNGVAGNVVFDINPDYQETITAKLLIGSAALNSGLNSTSSTRTVTFRRNPVGTGANPLVRTGFTGAGTANNASPAIDGILALRGADFITIDGIDLTDTNTVSNTTMMEYGYGLFKESANNGAQNNTIQNCNITLRRNNVAAGAAGTPRLNGSVGIAVYGASDTSTTSTFSSTTAAGPNCRNRFYSNRITNCNTGIGLSVAGPISPIANLGDSLNDLGGSTSATRNFIFGFGGGFGTAGARPGVAAVGVRANNQYSINISNNLIRNDSLGINHKNSVIGIQTSGSPGASINISNNYISITGDSSLLAVTGIDNQAGSTAASNTVTIRGNTVTGGHSNATTATWTGIYNSATAANVLIRSNTVRDVNIPATSTGAINLIQNAAAMTAGSNLNIDSNTIVNNTIGGTGTRVLLAVGAPGASSVATIGNNNLSGNTLTCPALPNNITLNCISIINPAASRYSVSGNIINQNSITNMTGAPIARINGFINAGGIQQETISNNTISNLFIKKGATASTGKHIIFGISNATNSSSTREVVGNEIFNLYSDSTITDSIVAIYSAAGGTVNISRNKIYNIFPGYNNSTPNNLGPWARGIFVITGTNVNIANNMVAIDLSQANSATSNVAGNSVLVSATGLDAIRGIDISSTSTNTNFSVFNNSIRLAGTGGTTFSSSGICHAPSATPTTARLDLRANVIVNECTPKGAGRVVAFRKSTTTNYPSNDSTISNYNNFFAGTPSANNLLYFDGTNGDSTLAAMQTRRAPRDANSISVPPAFTSATDLHLQTCNSSNVLIEDAYTLTPLVSTDIDNQARINPSDLGADEILAAGAGSVNSAASVCSGSNTGLLSLSGQLFGSQITKWQFSTDSTTWDDINNTTDSLRYNNLTDTTWYRVVVSNANCAAGTSRNVKITVSPAPTIGSLTAPAAVCAGVDTRVIRLGSYNPSNLSFTWRKGGINITNGGVYSGQGTDSLKLTNPTAVDAGSYDLVVGSAGCASVISNAVTLTVNDLPADPADASDTTVCGTSSVTVRTTASAGTTVDWYTASAGGTLLQSGTAAGVNSYGASPSVTSKYYAEIRNLTTGCKSAARDSSIVTVNAIPSANAPTYGAGLLTRCLNGSAFNSLTAQTVAGVTYQWYYNTTNSNSLTGAAQISGATNQLYTPPVNITYPNNYYFYTSTSAAGCSNVSPVFPNPFSVTPLPTTLPTVTNGSRCGTGTVSLTSNTSSNWYDLSSGGSPLTGGSAVTSFTTPSISVTDTFYVAAVLNGCVSTTRVPVVATIGAQGTWQGANASWANPANWCDGTPPTSAINVTIPVVASGIYPTISGAAAVNGLTIASGASLNISPTGILSASGSWINNGIVRDSGSIRLVGSTAAQNFPGGSTGTIPYINVLEIANTGAGSTTITAPLSISGALLPTSGLVSLGNNDITINSSADTTARVGIAGGSFSYTGTGRFIIERYISEGRKWQLLAAPIKTDGAQSVRSAWQEGNAPRGNNTPGFGTWITTNVSANLANGFDTLSPGGPSMKSYNPATNLYDGISSTNDSISRADGRGYFLFVRGDRSCSPTNGRISPTTMRTRGQVFTGDVLRNMTADSFACFGNPYPSAINFNNVNRSANITNAFYVWDPQLGGDLGLGQFRVCTSDGAGDYTVTPFSPNVPATASYPTNKNKFIQSGQAFFVFNPSRSAGQFLQFQESDKDATNRNVFRPGLTIANMVRVNLLAEEKSGTLSLLDGCMIDFSNNNNARVDGDDLPALSSGVRFCVNNGGNLLAVERRRDPLANDSIPIHMSGLRQRTYLMEVDAREWMLGRMQAFVKDNYMGTLTPLATGIVNILPFTVTPKPLSYAANRFVIVFRRPGTKGKQADADTNPAIVKQSVSSETGISIFPNPVVRGGVLNIDCSQVAAGKCKIEFADESGKTVFTRPAFINGKILYVPVPSDLPSGVYMLRLASRDGRKYSGKVMVE